MREPLPALDVTLLTNLMALPVTGLLGLIQNLESVKQVYKTSHTRWRAGTLCPSQVPQVSECIIIKLGYFQSYNVRHNEMCQIFKRKN